jgi:hypothetical protein
VLLPFNWGGGNKAIAVLNERSNWRSLAWQARTNKKGNPVSGFVWVIK